MCNIWWDSCCERVWCTNPEKIPDPDGWFVWFPTKTEYCHESEGGQQQCSKIVNKIEKGRHLDPQCEPSKVRTGGRKPNHSLSDEELADRYLADEQLYYQQLADERRFADQVLLAFGFRIRDIREPLYHEHLQEYIAQHLRIINIRNNTWLLRYLEGKWIAWIEDHSNIDQIPNKIVEKLTKRVNNMSKHRMQSYQVIILGSMKVDSTHQPFGNIHTSLGSGFIQKNGFAATTSHSPKPRRKRMFSRMRDASYTFHANI